LFESLEKTDIILEDMVSSNGTWLRLSKPREESRKVAMENKSVFNLGGKVVLTVENIV